MATDRFGNVIAAGLPYARGTILRSTEDDFTKLRQAWQIIRARIQKDGADSVFNFTGLERGLRVDPSDVPFLDDEIAPALFGERLTELALEHLGGKPDRHDVMVFNRLSAATLTAQMVMVRPGGTVIGVSVGYSHPSVTRAAAHLGARFVDTVGFKAFAEALDREPQVDLVVLTRLAVTYEALPIDEIRQIVALARARKIPVYADDAGGARVGPAVLGQPKMLDLGVNVGATGLDKYGTVGPRVGVLAGDKDLVARMRARAFEFGLEARPMLYPAVLKSLEQYRPERVQSLVECTKEVAAALRARLGDRLRETPVTAQLLGEDTLELARERAGLAETSLVPFEASATLAMLLLRDHGIVSVHFAGMPPGTSAMLFKFVPPETLQRFGGAAAFAEAVDHSLSSVAAMMGDREKVRALLLGPDR
jgi:L-seryl-tRNA(Ser) seleniumtransferase